MWGYLRIGLGQEGILEHAVCMADAVLESQTGISLCAGWLQENEGIPLCRRSCHLETARKWAVFSLWVSTSMMRD